MAQLNCNIKPIYCYVRAGYLYNHKQDLAGVDALRECTIFGVKSVHNKALKFWAHMYDGSIFQGLPISAFCWREDHARIADSEQGILNELQVWNCESYDMAVTTFSYLLGAKVTVKSRTGSTYDGHYLFTIDNYNGDDNYNQNFHADLPDSKQFHIIQLDNGWFAAYPHYKCVFYNPDIVGRPYDIHNPPPYRSPQQDWEVEHHQDFTAGHSEDMMYDFKRVGSDDESSHDD